MSMDVLTRPKPTVEEVRRRRALRSWIPSVVIAAFLLVLIVVTFALQTQGLGQARTLPPAVAAHGYSKFDNEGLRYISDTQTVWIDLRNKPMLAEPLKLPADGTTTIGPRDQIFSYLGLYGNNTAVKLPIYSLKIVTAGGQVTGIDAFVVKNGAFNDARGAIEAAAAYGLDPAATAAFVSEAVRFNRAGTAYDRTLGPGNALGTPILVTVSCSSSGSCGVHYLLKPGSN
jgi:hypothetical protein